MKLLSKLFALNEDLTEFVNSNNIRREDILTITFTSIGFILFYYSE